ncbi:inositol 1,4,5-trisphosphate receptor type 1 [Elysia marginata]|uniref:Inositol 1,4,5-trisphosphate receptor type 1 n=1 Tax=Elysia marginata TaxID=1093978 RepID=A0AAV4FIK6_9GAST|nr:inositol 1,4,5-trisphosphate receptor type 1 [Elysia marginata]
MVDPDLVEIFNYMAGMVPFIQKLVADALKEMENFMIVNSVPSKNRQKLMRNLRIVELLVSLLSIPCRGSPDQKHLTEIFLEAYDVLYTYLMGDSRKNELYIAKYIDFFLTQFEYKEVRERISSNIDFFLTQFEYKEGGIGLNAAHMVMELIRDNRKIVDRISHNNINTFVDFLHREKNYRYLELLSVLCVCDGVSIADNQKYITEVWLMRGNKNCVYLTDLGEKIGKKEGVVYVSVNNGKTWRELRDFAQNTGETSDEYLFLERQLELFGMLCHGQNQFAINVITTELDYLTWKESYTCLSDVNLPDRLRAKYCDLIITMFVDIGDNVSVVDRVKLSYIYDTIDSAEDQLDKSSSPTYKYFPQLSAWISEFLGTNGDMTASQIGNNMLVEQVNTPLKSKLK